MSDRRFKIRKNAKNRTPNFCMFFAEIWSNAIRQKNCFGWPRGLWKWFSGTCRRTWCGHRRAMLHVSLTSTYVKVSDAMSQSWVISCAVWQRLRESQEREPFFFRSMFFCFSLEARGSWFFLRSRFISLPWQTKIANSWQGRRRLRFRMNSRGVPPSLVVMKLHFQRRDYFFFSLIFCCFVSFVEKRRLWSGGRSHLRREAGGAHSPNGRRSNHS